MLDEIAGAIPDDIDEAVKAATAEVAKAFMQACMDDPSFEFGLLVVTFMAPDSTWRDGEPWGARHWSGKQRAVRTADVPPGVSLGRFAKARPDHAEWNAAFWLIGLKPDASGVVLRASTKSVEEPLQPLEDGQWAMGVVADFAGDLATRA